MTQQIQHDESTRTGFVTKAAWLRPTGRADAVDVVADEFERPAAPGAEAFWTPSAAPAWPRSARGWRSMNRLHAHPTDRLGADSGG